MRFFKKREASIDYDKLADAIGKNQSALSKDDLKQAIIEANKEIEDSKPKFFYSRELLKFVIEPMLWMFTVIGFIVPLALITYVFIYAKTWNYDIVTYVITIFVFVVLCLFSLLFALFSWFSLKEIEKTEDTNFVFSMFSNLIAFVALIVAAIALYKEIRG